MHIIHLSAECYPAAKVGGLADVVGSLPKYLNDEGATAEVVIPKYGTAWLNSQEYETVAAFSFPFHSDMIECEVQKVLPEGERGYNLYVIDIPGRFDRPGIYIDPWSGQAYWDEFERFLSFQIAALEWMRIQEIRPDILHCHDHHTGLVPLMTSQCNRFRDFRDIPVVFTVHNAEYHGQQSLDRYAMLPAFRMEEVGLLDWDGMLNPLAAALKTAWQVTTVSDSYMEELGHNSNGLESLFRHERPKSTGIVNGMDTDVWNPATDSYLDINFSYRDRRKGKKANKEVLCAQFGLNPEFPVISFIGRLVREKGADLLPDLFKKYMYSDHEVNFVLLGTGDPQLHEIFASMESDHMGYFDATLEYNEQLAHQIYAGSDFILMPSRVEPCGLNQMYAMRYGTIPIVREVGGLKDTVKDISEDDGYGITFSDFTLEAAEYAIRRAVNLYFDKKKKNETVDRIMKLDFSWNRSARKYISMYNSLTSQSL